MLQRSGSIVEKHRLLLYKIANKLLDEIDTEKKYNEIEILDMSINLIYSDNSLKNKLLENGNNIFNIDDLISLVEDEESQVFITNIVNQNLQKRGELI